MYKPPQNNNRVRSLKNKFEHVQKINSEKVQNNVYGNSLIKSVNNEALEETPILQRQTSDSLKMNIKRTPAFRVDKSVSENYETQREYFNKNNILESKRRLYTTIKNNCNNCNIWENNHNNLYDGTGNLVMFKNFDSSQTGEQVDDYKTHIVEISQQINCIPCKSEHITTGKTSSLYSQTIPKVLRSKVLHNNVIEKECDIYYTSNNISQKDESITELLTDTLKIALKKPLPVGPAPRKPPRTFQHTQEKSDMKKNISLVPLLISNKTGSNVRTKSIDRKTDAKYMLSKLENALKNNMLNIKKHKIDLSTTSEDSDDSILYNTNFDKGRLKFSCHIEKSFNFNCLSLVKCSQSESEINNQLMYNESDCLIQKSVTLKKKNKKCL